jgi:molybdate transport system substrate-binding protein
LILICLQAPSRAQETSLTLFAAASLTDVVEALALRWQAKGHPPLRLSFAASSTLARQIEAGAPADLYFSASTDWVDHLATRGLIAVDSVRRPIANRLVVIAPAAGAATDAPRLDDLAASLGRDDRLAVGDPDHVPAGIYARQALETLGQWPVLASRLARADNVRAALALVARGEAPLGIVYATDATLSDAVRVVGVLPEASHAPIIYPLAIVTGHDGPAARALLEFLSGPEAASLYLRHGFRVN